MKTTCISAILALVEVGAASGAVSDVWRFWSPVLSRHFYTISQTERDFVLGAYGRVWTYEGVAYRAYTSPDVAGLLPVYRFWSDRLSAHFYTISEVEKDLVAGQYADVWTYEGIAFYAWPPGAQPAGTVPVHRFWSSDLETHFYTASERERFVVAPNAAGVWADEGVAWYAWPAESGSPATIVKGPYLLWPEADSITVAWETNAAAPSRVDYGTAAPGESSVESADPVTLHRVALTGLAPQTSYVYRVTSDEAVSAVGNFTTAPSADRSFRVAVYGDSRSYPDAHAAVVQTMIDSGPDLVLHTGDIVSAGRQYELWGGEFFSPTHDLLLTTPIAAALGNHDYGGTGPLWYFYFFDLPYDAGWFALTYGNTRFIGLDTDVSYAPGSPQYQWLVAELASAAYDNATWNVVFFHHPPFTATSGHSDDTTVQSYLVPLFESYGVDLAFQGHSHAYERYWHNGVYYIVTGGGGSPLYGLTPDTVPPVRQAGRSVYHHCVVDIDAAAGTLTVSAVDNAGETFDTVELQR